MKIIAFTGAMGSGKSTTVNQLEELVENRGLQTYNAKFAAPLYEMQEEIYRIIAPVHTVPKGWVKDRKLLQLLGTEWGRQTLGENIWVDLWKQNVKDLVSSWPSISIITCDDLRFENEAKVIKELGGLIIKIVSDKERIDIKAGVPKHPSEGGLSNQYVDYVIENNGTIDDLRSALLTINDRHALW